MAYDTRPDELRERTQSTPGHKDRRRWCKGRAGKSHNIEVAIPPNLPGWRGACKWVTWFLRGGRRIQEWQCWHVYRCSTCGKQLDRLPPAQCPSRPKAAAS